MNNAWSFILIFIIESKQQLEERCLLEAGKLKSNTKN